MVRSIKIKFSVMNTWVTKRYNLLQFVFVHSIIFIKLHYKTTEWLIFQDIRLLLVISPHRGGDTMWLCNRQTAYIFMKTVSCLILSAATTVRIKMEKKKTVKTGALPYTCAYFYPTPPLWRTVMTHAITTPPGYTLRSARLASILLIFV